MFKLQDATALIEASKITKLAEATALLANMDVSKQAKATVLSKNVNPVERSKAKTPEKDSKTNASKQPGTTRLSMNKSMSGSEMSTVSRTSTENSEDFSFNPSIAMMEDFPPTPKEKKDPPGHDKK
ncbi:hypothetical protein D917_04109 [Trichinella nativa]|uniref:Uncharacterized protein n=1 Tax=Trichinella nativa TaxID=6335 RepID=A0A1Y3E5Y4_9BILA|nr:hypothetical protein D917_04109 [Trichinella nativa]